MAKKITKEDLIEVLNRLYKQKDIGAVRTEIDDIADEYNLDLNEPAEIDDLDSKDDKDAYLADDEVEELIGGGGNWDDEEDF